MEDSKMLQDVPPVYVNAVKRTNGVPAALQTSESSEWFTPTQYVEAAREVMGDIDIDPASCDEANRIVRAKKIYTKRDNGLLHRWSGRVWCNPPYGKVNGKSNQEIWSHRLIAQYHSGITTQAVLLINAFTGNAWFQRLWYFPICFTDHRIRFYSTDREAAQPTHGNALVYFGHNERRFVEVFRQFGPVVRAIPESLPQSSGVNLDLWTA